MITIGICDDDEFCRDDIREKCKAYFDETGEDCNLIEFSSGEEVVAYEGEMIHLLFLDIQMGGISGVEVMNIIRDNPLFWRIVFVTFYESYRLDSLDIKTLAYANKPIEPEIVGRCIAVAIREDRKNKAIVFESINGNISIKVEDIFYIVARKNYSTVYLKNSEINVYSSLKSIEEQTEGLSLQRIHRSSMVNLIYVDGFINRTVKMETGASLTIGRKYYNSFREAYFEIVRKYSIGRMK